MGKQRERDNGGGEKLLEKKELYANKLFEKMELCKTKGVKNQNYDICKRRKL